MWRMRALMCLAAAGLAASAPSHSPYGAAASALSLSTVSTTCGGVPYRVQLRHESGRKVLAIYAAGRPLAAPEIAKLSASLPAGHAFGQSVSVRCIRSGAEIRLGIDVPGARPPGLVLLVTPAGQVSALRRD